MPTEADRPSGRTALVTGASGFVGVNLVPELVRRGWRVRTLDLVPFHAPGVRDVYHRTGDVRDPVAVDRALDGVDVVFHLAARITLRSRDDDALDVNVRGPATVARRALAAGVERLVHTSSVHAFDLARARPRLHEGSPRAGSDRPVYDRSKAAGEAEVRAVVADGLDAVVVNPTGIIGPIDLGPSRANGVLLAAARGHLPIAVAGGFDWVDVRDVVAGLVAAAARGRCGEGYLLGGHQATSVEIGRLAAGLNARLGPVVGLPPGLARGLAPVGERIGLIWGSDDLTPASIGTLLDDPIVDHGKAAAELGHRPRPLEDTVGDLVRWFRGEGHLTRRHGRWRSPGWARTGS